MGHGDINCTDRLPPTSLWTGSLIMCIHYPPRVKLQLSHRTFITAEVHFEAETGNRIEINLVPANLKTLKHSPAFGCFNPHVLFWQLIQCQRGSTEPHCECKSKQQHFEHEHIFYVPLLPHEQQLTNNFTVRQMDSPALRKTGSLTLRLDTCVSVCVCV